MPHATGRALNHLRASTSLKLFVLPGGSQVKLLESYSTFGSFTFYCEEMSFGGKDDHHIAMISSEFVGDAIASKIEDDLEVFHFRNLMPDKTTIEVKDLCDSLYDSRIIILPIEMNFMNSTNIISIREGKDDFYCDTLEFSLRSF